MDVGTEGTLRYRIYSGNEIINLDGYFYYTDEDDIDIAKLRGSYNRFCEQQIPVQVYSKPDDLNSYVNSVGSDSIIEDYEYFELDN